MDWSIGRLIRWLIGYWPDGYSAISVFVARVVEGPHTSMFMLFAPFALYTYIHTPSIAGRSLFFSDAALRVDWRMGRRQAATSIESPFVVRANASVGSAVSRSDPIGSAVRGMLRSGSLFRAIACAYEPYASVRLHSSL